MIRMIRIGMIRMRLQVRHMWRTIIFDVPEGMELMVHVRRRDPYGSDIREDEQTGLAHVCQTSLCDTRDELDTVDVDSLTEAFAEDVQDTDDFHQRIVSSDEEDFGDPDDGAIADNDRHAGLTPVCQTLLCDTRDVLDTVDVDSMTGGFTEKLPDTDDFYQGIVSSDEEDFSEPDDGSVEDFEKNTWADWYGSVFGTAFGVFPSEADGPQPAVMFSDCLFSEEELADTVVSVHGEVPMLPLRRFADVGVAVIPPVANLPVFINRLVGRNNRIDEVSVLSWPVCDPPIRIDVANVALSHSERVLLACTPLVGDV